MLERFLKEKIKKSSSQPISENIDGINSPASELLKEDYIDRTNKWDPLFSYGTFTLGILGPTSLLYSYISGETMTNPYFVVLGLGGFSVAYALYNMGSEYKKPTGQLSDPELGYDLFHLTFRAASNLPAGNTRLSRKDNFMYLRLPSITAENPIDSRLETDLVEISVKDAREKLAKKSYQAVCIDSSTHMPDNVSEILSQHGKVNINELLIGKGTELKSDNPDCFVLTPEEFEQLTLGTHKMFYQGLEKVADNKLSELINLAQNCHLPSQREKALELVFARLKELMDLELEKNHSGPTVVAGRQMPSYTPTRTRIYEVSAAEENQDGQLAESVLFAKTSNSNGEIRKVELAKVLEVTGKSPEQCINSLPDKLQKGRVIFGLYRLLRERPLDDLFVQASVEKNDVLTRIVESKVAVERNFSLQSLTDFNEVRNKNVRRIPDRLTRTFLALSLFFSVTHVGKQFLDDRSGIEKAISNDSGVSQLVTSQAINFFDEPPKKSLDWAVYERGDISSAGYYVESTGSQMLGNSWIFEQEFSEHIFVPEEYDGSESKIYLVNRIKLDPHKSNFQKIPRHTQTKLAAFRVLGPENRSIPNSLIKLKDGTILMALNSGTKLGTNWVDLVATFTESSQSEIKAVRPLVNRADSTPISIKDEHLTDEWREKMNFIDRSSLGTGFWYDILVFDEVLKSRKYSLFSPAAEQIRKANNPYSLLDILNNLKECLCSTCNTQSVLLTSKNPYPDSMVNIAFGYLHNLAYNPASGKGSYLRGEARHAFGIDKNGNVLDSTPVFEIAPGGLGDSSPNGEQSSDEIDDQNWEDLARQIVIEDDQRQRTEGSLKFLFFALGSLPTFLIGQKAFNTLWGYRERRYEFIEKFLLGFVSTSDLEKAYSFATWVSFGEKRPTELEIPDFDSESKYQILGSIRRNVLDTKLDDYDKSPTAWEKLAKPLSWLDKQKLRFISKNLLYQE